MFLDEGILRVEVVAVMLLVLPVVARLDLDGDLRMDGVRRDSWAFGSSNVVYLPMEGRWMT